MLTVIFFITGMGIGVILGAVWAVILFDKDEINDE